MSPSSRDYQLSAGGVLTPAARAHLVSPGTMEVVMEFLTHAPGLSQLVHQFLGLEQQRYGDASALGASPKKDRHRVLPHQRKPRTKSFSSLCRSRRHSKLEQVRAAGEALFALEIAGPAQERSEQHTMQGSPRLQKPTTPQPARSRNGSIGARRAATAQRVGPGVLAGEVDAGPPPCPPSPDSSSNG